MTIPNDLRTLSAKQAVRMIADGVLRSEDLTEAYLARISEREPLIQAFAHFDADYARKSAASARPGALHGLPVGLKDVLDTADMPSQYGSPIWAGWRPKADSAPVAWARAAGAVFHGKTVTTEFATRKPGPTANPANPGHTPGGSSSGSAAGVADGMFPVAFGTQTAGSIIRPAAYCGVVGYKPTYGMISRIGMKIMADSLDTVGVMARSVADCAFFAGVVAGRDLGNPDAHPGRSPRIGICRSPSWDLAAPETETLLARVETALARAGATVEARELPAAYAALKTAHPIVMNAESARALGWELATHPDGISVGLRERLEFGIAQTEAALTGAYDVFASTQQAFPDVDVRTGRAGHALGPGRAPRPDWNGPAIQDLISSGHRCMYRA